MEALVDTASREAWDARIVGVVSDRPQAAGLAWARGRGLHTVAIDRTQYADRDAFDDALDAAVAALAPDLVLLAGFMRILRRDFVQRHAGRMLNVHPSLLPAFPGLHTHRRALENGCAVAGATVHLVTAELDHGPIVVQAVVPVRPDDDEATLAARVLAQEHRIYPLAVRWWLDGLLQVDGLRVQHRLGADRWVFAA